MIHHPECCCRGAPKQTKACLLRPDGQNHIDLRMRVSDLPPNEVCKNCPVTPSSECNQELKNHPNLREDDHSGNRTQRPNDLLGNMGLKRTPQKVQLFSGARQCKSPFHWQTLLHWCQVAQQVA